MELVRESKMVARVYGLGKVAAYFDTDDAVWRSVPLQNAELGLLLLGYEVTIVYVS